MEPSRTQLVGPLPKGVALIRVTWHARQFELGDYNRRQRQ